MIKKLFFVEWYKNNGRIFPWRNICDPFKISVTEIFLRQTRAENVAKIWNIFFLKYKHFCFIQNSDSNEIKKIIHPLGLENQRLIALKNVSNYIISNYDGIVPSNREDLIKIPHIGQYISSAILCFAFGHKIAIVDTNILRFFSRFFNLKIKDDIRLNEKIWEIAHEFLPQREDLVKFHNYGLLDFTNQICKSKKPNCQKCPLNYRCQYIK